MRDEEGTLYTIIIAVSYELVIMHPLLLRTFPAKISYFVGPNKPYIPDASLIHATDVGPSACSILAWIW